MEKFGVVMVLPGLRRKCVLSNVLHAMLSTATK